MKKILGNSFGVVLLILSLVIASAILSMPFILMSQFVSHEIAYFIFLLVAFISPAFLLMRGGKLKTIFAK